MKKSIVILLALAFINCKKQPDNTISSGSDTMEAMPGSVRMEENDTVTSKTKADPIADIRKRVEHINTAALDKKHYEFMCDEKMKVDYFYDNGELVKVAVDFGTVGDVYAKEGYYYDNGRIIFNYEYTEGGPACDDCIETNEYRSYVQNDKVIRYIRNKDITQCRTCGFNVRSRQYKVLKATNENEVKAALCR